MPRSTTERGYGSVHQQKRRTALAKMRDGDPCTRCGQPMRRTEALDLDHSDDRSRYLGLAHARCNRAAGGRKARAAHRPATFNPSQQW